MNALDEIFGTSPDAESGAGVVLDYGRAGKFTIHRAGGSNRKFEKRREALMKPYTRQIQTNTMDDDVAKKLFAQLYAETVVVGWNGVPGDDGADRAFTVEHVTEVLIRYPDLFADIRAAANDRSLFLADAQEAAVGNSPKASAGTSSGANKPSGSPS